MATENPTTFDAFKHLADRDLARNLGYPLPGGTQPLAISGSVATSTKLPVGSSVLLMSTVDCFVQVSTGTPGTASTSADMPLSANTPTFITLGGAYVYVSGITTGASGTLYITQMAGA